MYVYVLYACLDIGTGYNMDKCLDAMSKKTHKLDKDDAKVQHGKENWKGTLTDAYALKVSQIEGQQKCHPHHVDDQHSDECVVP